MAISGVAPAPRNQFGCTLAGGLIYGFGGFAGACKPARVGPPPRGLAPGERISFV